MAVIGVGNRMCNLIMRRNQVIDMSGRSYASNRITAEVRLEPSPAIANFCRTGRLLGNAIETHVMGGLAGHKSVKTSGSVDYTCLAIALVP